MRPLLFFILVSYLLVQIAETALTLLNLRHLSVYGERVPPGFEGQTDPKLLARMRDYAIAGSRLDLVSSVFTAGATLLFIFGGLLAWYNRLILKAGLPPVWSGVVFFLVLAVGGMLLKSPFSFYSTFYIERKYGFNNQTAGLWAADLVKGLLLAVVLNGLLLAAVFWLINRFPHTWWLFAWGVLFFFSIFLLYVSPTLIEPLFNKFTPIADRALEEEIRRLLQRGGIAVARVFVMDASRRSTHTNAYFSGIGRVKRIVLFDTLLNGMSQRETLAILAHEAGHWRKRHLVRKLAVMEAMAFLGLYLVSLLVEGNGLSDLFGISPSAMEVKLLLAGFIGAVVSFPLQPLVNHLSRRQEIEADDYAVGLTGDPASLARSLVTLGRANLANLHPHPLYAAFYYSHPPLAERVGRLQNLKQGGPA